MKGLHIAQINGDRQELKYVRFGWNIATKADLAPEETQEQKICIDKVRKLTKHK